jgi:hypothetical protein
LYFCWQCVLRLWSVSTSCHFVTRGI